MFPIGDDQIKGGHFPYFTYVILAINVAIYFFEATLGPQQLQNLFFEYGCVPQYIMSGERWYTLITSMFLHGGLMHLVGNMMFLWVFGDNIEAIIGNVQFLAFYILGGLFASFVHIGFNLNSGVPSVGASGAIAAVLGAYIIMFPHSRIKTFAFLFFFNIPAFMFLGIWIIQQFMSGIASLSTSSATSSGVAWWAHIGGFVIGVAGGLLFKNKARAHFVEKNEPLLRPVRDEDRLYY